MYGIMVLVHQKNFHKMPHEPLASSLEQYQFGNIISDVWNDGSGAPKNFHKMRQRFDIFLVRIAGKVMKLPFIFFLKNAKRWISELARAISRHENTLKYLF